MNTKIFAASAMAAAVLLTAGAAAETTLDASSGGSAPSASSGAASSRPAQAGQHFFCSDAQAMKILSDITKISRKDLAAKYPQQTAWQIAKTTNKLSDLKKQFLAQQRTALDRMVTNGQISSADDMRIYADVLKRVEAIDGVKTVTVGRPMF